MMVASFTIRLPAFDAFAASLRDLGTMVASSEAALELLDESPRLFLERLISSEEGSDLIFCKVPTCSAMSAGHHHSLKLDPSDEYLELFFAFAALHGNACTVICHGWPILSLAGDIASVAEAGERCTFPGGCAIGEAA